MRHCLSPLELQGDQCKTGFLSNMSILLRSCIQMNQKCASSLVESLKRCSYMTAQARKNTVIQWYILLTPPSLKDKSSSLYKWILRAVPACQLSLGLLIVLLLSMALPFLRPFSMQLGHVVKILLLEQMMYMANIRQQQLMKFVIDNHGSGYLGMARCFNVHS